MPPVRPVSRRKRSEIANARYSLFHISGNTFTFDAPVPYLYIYDIQFFLLLERRKSIILALITHLHMHYSSLLSSSSSPPYTVSILPTNQFHSIRQFHSLHSIVIIISLDETNICDTDHSLTHSLTHSTEPPWYHRSYRSPTQSNSFLIQVSASICKYLLRADEEREGEGRRVAQRARERERD